VDNLGNVSAPLVKTIPTDTVTTATPIVQSPTNNQSNVGLTPILSVSGFDARNRANASMSDKKHIQTQWIIEETVNGAVVEVVNSGFDVANLTSYAVPLGALKYGHTYTLKVRFFDEKYGWGAISSPVVFVTAAYGSIRFIQKLWNERTVGQRHPAGALSADGKRIAVGTFSASGLPSYGFVDIYDYENGSFVLKYTIQNTDPVIAGYTGVGSGAGYGTGVALSANGLRLFVACSVKYNSTTDKSKIFIYDFDGTNWVLRNSIRCSTVVFC
jgi:hypothetical protein